MLLGSPLLGSSVWEPVADRLRERGWPVTVPRLGEAVRTPQDVLRALEAQLPPTADLVLVPHSNAGLYVGALAAVRRVVGAVFVDAGLPAPAPTTPTAPQGFRAHLGRLAGDDGLLPPWTEWWPDSELEAVLPDPGVRDRVRRHQPRLPLSYFDAEVPSPAGWEATPAAYLGFGDTYAEEQADAHRKGWPVEVLAGRHLHLVVDPAMVAAAVHRLLRVIGLTPPEPPGVVLD